MLPTRQPGLTIAPAHTTEPVADLHALSYHGGRMNGAHESVAITKKTLKDCPAHVILANRHDNTVMLDHSDVRHPALHGQPKEAPICEPHVVVDETDRALQTPRTISRKQDIGNNLTVSPGPDNQDVHLLSHPRSRETRWR